MSSSHLDEETCADKTPSESTGKFDHDTDTLLVQAKIAIKTASVLRKQQKKIKRKQQKTKSKELPKCIEKYNTSLKEIREAINRTQDALSEGKFTDMTREGRNKLTRSISLQKTGRNRFREQTDTTHASLPAKTSQKECLMCTKNEKKIKELEDKLKSSQQNAKECEELLRKYQDEGDQSEKYQRFYNEEREGKEDARQSLQQNAKEYEELLRKYQDERDQSEKNQRLYKEEREGKEDARQSLQQNAKEYEELLRKFQNEKDQSEKYQRLYKEEREGKEDARQSTEKFDHDTDTLLIQAKIAKEAASVLGKTQKKIERKQLQTKSKNLPKCIEKYNTSLKEIREAINRMQNALSEGGFTDMTREGRNKSKRSLSLPKKGRGRFQEQTETTHASLPPNTSLKECLMCMKNEKKIKELEDKLKSLQQNAKEYEELLQKNQDERDQSEKYQRLYKVEREGKEDARQSLQQKARECEELLRKYQDERDQLEKYQRLHKEEREGKENALQSLQQNANEYKELLRKYQDERDQLEKYQRLHKEEREGKKDALHSLKQTDKECKEFKRKYHDERDQRAKYQGMFKEEQEGKEDALRRLSAIASSKLRDNNPNIADLSDQNRPTKIAEKMSELYDNQWTEAYSVLEDKGLREKQIIKSLLDMFMTAFEVCSKLASENFFERVQRCIEIPIEGEQPTNYTVVMPDQLKQQVKEFRKTRARFVIEEIETIAKKRIQIENQEAVSEYLTHCIEIGWFCVVQDPPLVVRRDAPVKFDTNIYKEYTRRGKYTEFVVWPALYLHDGGALLSKGVAQGIDTQAPNNEASTASGMVSSAGYQPQNPHYTNSATAPKAKHVTEIHVQEPVFDGARSVDN